MGNYLCIASNGVPPAVSKRIQVSVDCESLRLILCHFCLDINAAHYGIALSLVDLGYVYSSTYIVVAF